MQPSPQECQPVSQEASRSLEQLSERKFKETIRQNIPENIQANQAQKDTLTDVQQKLVPQECLQVPRDQTPEHSGEHSSQPGAKGYTDGRSTEPVPQECLQVPRDHSPEHSSHTQTALKDALADVQQNLSPRSASRSLEANRQNIQENIQAKLGAKGYTDRRSTETCPPRVPSFHVFLAITYQPLKPKTVAKR